jgi:hypothetical protein
MSGGDGYTRKRPKFWIPHSTTICEVVAVHLRASAKKCEPFHPFSEHITHLRHRQSGQSVCVLS